MPLRKGIKLIGFYDLAILILDLLLTIASGRGRKMFVMPDPSKYWLLIIKIFTVDLFRVAAFALSAKFDYAHKCRLMMLFTRLITIAIEILLIYEIYTKCKDAKAGMVVFDSLFVVVNFYFAYVMLSYYLTSNQEEIQIELQRLGQEEIRISHVMETQAEEKQQQ